MKVTVLVENTACTDQVIAQHGLSLYLETENHRILFDMGQSDAFIHNAQALKIDLSKVDIAVLSHGHYDHGGGLEAFLQVNQKAPVYIHESAFGLYYNGTEKYIGLNPSLLGNPRLVPTKGSLQVTSNLILRDCNELEWQFDSWGLNKREGEVFRPDDFTHEQYLEVKEGEKRILISGCSHKGILNIAEHFQPDILIGGFHLNKQEDILALQETAKRLLDGSTRYFTGHCTGDKQFDLMKEVMADRLERISTGMIFEV